MRCRSPRPPELERCRKMSTPSSDAPRSLPSAPARPQWLRRRWPAAPVAGSPGTETRSDPDPGCRRSPEHPSLPGSAHPWDAPLPWLPPYPGKPSTAASESCPGRMPHSGPDCPRRCSGHRLRCLPSPPFDPGSSQSHPPVPPWSAHSASRSRRSSPESAPCQITSPRPAGKTPRHPPRSSPAQDSFAPGPFAPGSPAPPARSTRNPDRPTPSPAASRWQPPAAHAACEC